MADKSNADSTGKFQFGHITNSSLKTVEQNSTSELQEQIKSQAEVEVTADDNQVTGLIYPSRFNDVVPLIAQITEAGFVCFLNPVTLELEQVSGKMLDNPEAFYASSDGSSRKIPFNHLLWNDCLMFEPVPEEELYRLVDDFMQYLTGLPIHNKLTRLMKKNKPFWKLNTIIIKTKHSEFWKRYKQEHIEKQIKDKLVLLLPDKTD